MPNCHYQWVSFYWKTWEKRTCFGIALNVFCDVGVRYIYSLICGWNLHNNCTSHYFTLLYSIFKESVWNASLCQAWHGLSVIACSLYLRRCACLQPKPSLPWECLHVHARQWKSKTLVYCMILCMTYKICFAVLFLIFWCLKKNLWIFTCDQFCKYSIFFNLYMYFPFVLYWMNFWTLLDHAFSDCIRVKTVMAVAFSSDHFKLFSVNGF